MIYMGGILGYKQGYFTRTPRLISQKKMMIPKAQKTNIVVNVTIRKTPESFCNIHAPCKL